MSVHVQWHPVNLCFQSALMLSSCLIKEAILISARCRVRFLYMEFTDTFTNPRKTFCP